MGCNHLTTFLRPGISWPSFSSSVVYPAMGQSPSVAATPAGADTGACGLSTSYTPILRRLRISGNRKTAYLGEWNAANISGWNVFHSPVNWLEWRIGAMKIRIDASKCDAWQQAQIVIFQRPKPDARIQQANLAVTARTAGSCSRRCLVAKTVDQLLLRSLVHGRSSSLASASNSLFFTRFKSDRRNIIF